MELNAEAESPDLWNDPEAAQRVMRARTRTEKALVTFDGLVAGLEDNIELLELAELEGAEDAPFQMVTYGPEGPPRDLSPAELRALETAGWQ